MYGSSSRPFTVEELLDMLRRAAEDCCGVAVDQEEQFDRDVDGAVRRPDKQQPMDAQRCKSGQSSARICERAHYCLLQGNARQPLRCSVGTPSTCCVGKVALLQCWHVSSMQRWQAVDHAVLSVDQAICRIARCLMPAAAIVTMVDPVTNAGVADTLEARLADARKHHTDGEHGTIPLLIVELGRRWRRQESGASAAVDGDCRQLASQRRWSTSLSSMKRWWALGDDACVSGRDCTDVGYFKFSPDRITVALLQGRRDLITWMESIEPQLDVAGLKGFADGTVPIPPVDDVGLRGEFRAAHFLTFMVISRCCSPVVQLALRSCQERLDAGHQAWHFILSTYQVRDDLYIAQLEENMTHILMDEQESATDYCNRARRILAEMRMAGAEYSTASYISHIVKGLPRGYNLMKRMMMVPGTHESLDEDSIASYILQDEAMQEAKQPTELLPQANYTTSTKLNQQQGQRRKPGGGGRGSGRSTKDVDEKRSTRDKGRGGAVRRRECWICHDPNHLSYECPDRDDSDEDDTKGVRSRSTSRRPHRDAKSRKEKQTLRKMSSTKDVGNSSAKSQGDGEASCSMVGVVEPMVSLAPEAGEDF
ncbi:unnamed protein product [Closterium sp. NIES-54]